MNTTTTLTIACDMATDLNNAGLINHIIDTDDRDLLANVVDACYDAWAEAAVEIGAERGIDVEVGRYQPGRFEGDPHVGDDGYTLAGEIWQAAHDRIDAEAIIASVVR